MRKLYSVRDEKACFFASPFPASTNGEAIRSFSDATQDPNTLISKYPADFTLYYVADFNEETGEVNPVIPSVIAKGSDFVA